MTTAKKKTAKKRAGKTKGSGVVHSSDASKGVVAATAGKDASKGVTAASTGKEVSEGVQHS